MVRKNRWMYAAILLVCGIGMFTSCQGGTPLRKVNGVLEAPVADMAYEKEDAYMAPEIVENAYAHTVKVHTFELMSDTANHTSWKAQAQTWRNSTRCSSERPTTAPASC